jgi:hypothetical protein
MNLIEIVHDLMKDPTIRKTSWNSTSFARWLGSDFLCVYCGKYMLDSYDLAYYGSTVDHLLPVSAYPELKKAEWNLVLACRTCNGFKGRWDANHPVLYIKNTQVIAPEHRQILLERAKAHVDEIRKPREELFEKERAVIEQRLERSSVAGAGS